MLRNNWKKLSVFFELPNWGHNILRHTLDLMHIENNVCDNVIGTLFNLKEKSKDSLKARLDLGDIGIRKSLHLHILPITSKAYLSPAYFIMDTSKKELFCIVLKSVKVLDRYSSNILRHVNIKDCRICRLKSQNYHVILQQFLPFAARKALLNNVSSVLIELRNFFTRLCSKECQNNELRRLEEKNELTLVHLKRICQLRFFDVILHLSIHLDIEVWLGGPVHYQWMHPIERYIMKLINIVSILILVYLCIHKYCIFVGICLR